jgi:hypothetical protein
MNNEKHSLLFYWMIKEEIIAEEMFINRLQGIGCFLASTSAKTTKKYFNV